MHSVARENLQAYLHSYKSSSKEPGIPIIHNSSVDERRRKHHEHISAIQALEGARKRHVAFAVQAQRDYDGSVDERAPIKGKTVSFANGDFIHIFVKFNAHWWIGRIVRSHSEFGFVPTARRLANYMIDEDVPPPPPPPPSQNQHEKSIWEPKCAYKVVPCSRPIIFLGPTLQHSRLTQLLHLALREEVLKHFGKKMKYLKSDIGCSLQGAERGRGARWLRGGRENRDANENQEVELIMRMTSKLHLVLVDSPHIHTPDDILCKLLRNTGSTRMTAEIEVANVLKTMNNDRVGDEELLASGFDMVIEENGLKEATWRIISFLEKYLHALHYHPNE
ncbi:unnamed protein product [Caenorhabditis bovis]|uniref:SH3 domain-containing protein n=1 Tax=Caenorhabditis bovis TaxID=2654633 RepID=A0A8S1F0Z9_9PELO|nr:unnamed protein product [Caenorhabditis bovis]